MNYKLSIIVPVYNTEKYLKKCLETLINQSLDNIEIIIVNDGSTDNSQQIIEQYKQKYPLKIKSLFQKNSGQASARNLGIECATGEFIAFVDSDDYVETCAYEKAYNYMTENNLDIVCFNFWEEKKNKKEVSQYCKFKNYNVEVKYILNETSPVNKIIRRSIFIENGLRFKEKNIYEDLELIPKLALYTNKIGFINECLYNYVIHDNSTMRQKEYNKKLDSIYYVMESLKTTLEDTKYTKELEYIFIEHLLHGAVLRYLEYEEGRKDIEKISNIMKENFPKWRKNLYYKKQGIRYKIICTLAYYKKIKILKRILKK